MESLSKGMERSKSGEDCLIMAGMFFEVRMKIEVTFDGMYTSFVIVAKLI